MWGLWWMEWHWSAFFPRLLQFGLANKHFHHSSLLLYHSSPDDAAPYHILWPYAGGYQ
jgi:hypothetical protein